MKQAFLIIAVLFCFVASAQYNPTSSKTRFVNGIGLGTKSDAAFGTVDSLVLYAKADSTLMFKYKGTARALAYASQLSGYVPFSGSSTVVSLGSRLNVNGATDNARYPLNVTGNLRVSDSAIINNLLTASLDVYVGRKQSIGSSSLSAATLYVLSNDNTIPVIRAEANGTQDVFEGRQDNTNITSTISNTGNAIFKGFVQTNSGGAGGAIKWNYGTNGSSRSWLAYNDVSANGDWHLAQSTTQSGSTYADILSSSPSGVITVHNLGTGTVYSNSGALTNTNPSDSTIKNTIKPLGYGLAEVLKLQPKTFYYNSDTAKTSLKYGFIAQEVQKIMPDLVRSFNVTKTVDSSGVKVQKIIQKLGLESDGIYVTLVKAIQEQQVIIDDLKKRIIALENK